MYKSSRQCRHEGEKAFEHDHYGRDRNSYPKYDSYERARYHKDWDDGFRSAERRVQEIKEEEEYTLEKRKAQRRHEDEVRRQQEENEYYWEQRRLEDEE